MDETRHGPRRRGRGERRSGPCRSVIGDGIGLLRASRVLLALVGVELFWGFSMVTFESLFPIRLVRDRSATPTRRPR